jgi:hypothetical protein
MGTSFDPSSGSFYDSATAVGKSLGIRLREQCERLRGQAETERATFLAQWKDLGDHILPRRPRFQLTDVNKGDRRTQKIIDSTATEAAGILSAGMMSGVTSPARPWFKLTVPNTELKEQEDVKEWLHDVEEILSSIFLKSNLYDILPIMYGDAGVFGTSVMAVMEDDEDVIRCYEYPVGSYMLLNDDKLRVRTWIRTWRYTVDQVVTKWGEINPQTGKANFQDGRPTTISSTVQRLWNANTLQSWVDLCHVIRPNVSYDGEKIDAKYKKYESIIYERGVQGNQGEAGKYGLLEHGGFDEFPVLCLRWEVNSEDVYGTNCPGMKSLGDIRALQTREKRIAQAEEAMLKPPLTGPARLMSVKVSTIPGDITYDPGSSTPNDGLRPIYQVKFDIGPSEEKQEQIRMRIKNVFYTPLFLMLAEADNTEKTATEINERKEEKMLVLGPVLQRADKDLLSPLIDRTFNVAARKGLIPPAPESLQNQALRIEYVSIMALAQKRVGIEGLERTLSFAGQSIQINPETADAYDFDELQRQHADAMGTPPKILRPQEQIDQIRQQRAQQQAQQQAAQNIPALAGAMKDASQTPTGGETALSALLGKRNASSTLNATNQPPSQVVQ